MTKKSVEIEVNFLETKEVDMAPKEKKRVRVEEYDYADDFLEPFEGDDQLVDLECNVDNFFIFKGAMDTNPKKIARKYNYKIKKTEVNEFEFENVLEKKPKRDPKFHNLCYYLIYQEYEETKNPSRKTILRNILENINRVSLPQKKSVEEENEKVENKSEAEIKVCALNSLLDDNHDLDVDEEYAKYKDELHGMISKKLFEINDITKDLTNYTQKLKTFEFKKTNLIEKIMELIVDYTLYYYKDTSEFVQNKAVGIIGKMFYEECSNWVSIKHYVIQEIKKRNTRFDFNELYKGNFVEIKESE